MTRRQVPRKLLQTAGWLLALSLVTDGAHAQDAKAQLKAQMVAQGKWSISATEAKTSWVWYVDTYSIVKIRDEVYEINVTRRNPENQYDPDNTFTAEIDCGRLTATATGWRVSGNMTYATSMTGARRMGWKNISIPKNSIWYNNSVFVCGLKNSGKFTIIAGTYRLGDLISAFRADNNTIYVKSDNNMMRYIENLSINRTYYFDCDRRILVQSDQAGAVKILASPQANLPAAMLSDWVCLKLHPDTQLVSRSFDFPGAPPPAAPTEVLSPSPVSPPVSASGADVGDLGEAKKACADLGFKAGTPKFGQCVLRLSK